MKLDETFATVKPDLSVETAARTPSVYAELVASYQFESDWGVWEIHPAGDEIVILLSGAATLRIKIEFGENVVELREPGSFAVVPRNYWHTAEIREATWRCCSS